jgi:SAM-dependent methyltransferase
MNHYTTSLYTKYVEQMNDIGFQNYMKRELEFIRRIPNSKDRTFIDLGAGYGRVEKELSDQAREVIAVELLDDMYEELNSRAKRLTNVKAVQADMTNLEKALKDFVFNSPVFLILQNTLGVIEGDIPKFITDIKAYAKTNNGEIIFSLFRQEDFKDWGIHVYEKARPVVGEVDLDSSNVEQGEIKSSTNYTSKWWTRQDVDNIKLDVEVKDEEVGLGYYLLRIKP